MKIPSISRILGLLAILLAFPISLAQAQVSVTVVDAQGQPLELTGKNTSRTDHALILYDDQHGDSTRTNPFGVEVIAVPARGPAEKTAHKFEVQSLSSIWECQKQNNESTCGNAEIPHGGIVLSASGDKREALLQRFKPGDVIEVRQEWFRRTTAAIDAIDPTPLNNPKASGFPGYRGGNQLILYDKGYDQPTTGTNEFGFEVTVQDGIVVDQEGSNSTIPENGFVLSGHGRAANWLINHAPVGARITVHEDGRELTSLVNYETYEYQLAQRLKKSPCADPAKSRKLPLCGDIEKTQDESYRLYMGGNTDAAIGRLTGALDKLNRFMWTQYPAFAEPAIKAAWHRPVERTRTAIQRTLDTLQKSGLNTVFLETFFHGYTIFPSETYAAYGLPTQNPKFAGVDILKIWIDEAHKRGMQVHPWFQTFYGGTNAYLPPGPILAKYPEWTNVQYSSLDLAKRAQLKLTPSTLELGAYFLDPANPAVQDFLAKLAEEIVTRYDVDGLQLDYIRYPASFPADRFSYHKTTWGYTPVARAAFQAQYNVDPIDLDPKKDVVLWKAWGDFKVAQINRFVERVSHSLHQKRPSIKVSSAIFPERESALLQKHQDWQYWALSGWVDFLAPMTLTSAVKVVGHDTQYVIDAVQGKIPVYSGIFGPFNNNTAEQVLEQIDAARKAGAGGFSLFDTAHITGRMNQALHASQGANPSATRQR